MAIVRWKPRKEMFAVQDEINRMFDNLFENIQGEDGAMLNPPTDIVEDNDRYVVSVELPGMKKDEIKLTLEDNTLTISGTKNRESETKKDRYHRVERSFGSFCRTLTLPSKVESQGISAEFKDGILKVNVPKSEGARQKEISIEG